MENTNLSIDVNELTRLQHETVAVWHERNIENHYDGFLTIVCQQHAFNFQLWHEEDIARCQDVSDSEIARVKRAIDGLNQQRNDWIERIDDEISNMVLASGMIADDSSPLNTETPGSAIDRLSILALRIYHLREQLRRADVSPAHIESVENKIAVCLLQEQDLKTSLQQLIDDIFDGKKRHRTYRQFKMYNDPSLNPFLYRAKKSA